MAKHKGKDDKGKTNAARQLDAFKISYKLIDIGDTDEFLSGVEMAGRLGIASSVVFKTLVTKGASGAILVFVIPSDMELDLKKAAKHVGEKNVAMLPVVDILQTTGYVKGGCSPIGMKKLYPTAIDMSALTLSEIYVSAGRKGQQILISPQGLATVVHADFADLTV